MTMNHLHPPAGDGSWLLYRGFWYNLADFENITSERVGIGIIPAGDRGPYTYRKGTFYTARLTDEQITRLNEPWMILARALGKLEASQELERVEAKHPLIEH